jgi:hypothetical protein
LKEGDDFSSVILQGPDFLCAMSRATIDDQEDFAFGVLDQAFQEFDEDIGVGAALVGA